MGEVHMCGAWDCACPTTAEFAQIVHRLIREHEEQARLIVAQLLTAIPAPADLEAKG